MKKAQADRIIEEMVKPIYGFALSKTNDSYQAEDLAGRIILEVYESLLKKDDIRDCRAYSMVIAMNIWKRFITKKVNTPRMFPLDYANLYSLEKTADTLIINKEEEQRLRREIAFLSNQQRQVIILYYFESKDISTISQTMNIPEGTVKWHLFEARKELKMGIKKQMEIGVQGINPIKLTSMGHGGWVGTSGNTDEILSTLLSQNIIWLCYKKKYSHAEIAKELGVNPLFIEDEIQRLAEMGFLEQEDDGKYLSDMWIYEPSHEKDEMYTAVYAKYAKMIVDLFFIKFDNIGKKALKISEVHVAYNNPDSFKWSAILHSFNRLYFKELENVNHDALSKHRIDGGKYVAFAVIDNDMDKSLENDHKHKICGDMWRGDDKVRGWQLDTYWSGRNFDWKDVKTSDFTGLNEFINTSNLNSDKNIDLLKRLIDKKLIYKDGLDFKPAINIIRGQDPEAVLNKLYPSIEKEVIHVGRMMDNAIKSIVEKDAPAINKDYISYMSQNNLSKPMFRPYVIEEMLNRGLLKELPEYLQSGIGIFMFVKE